MVKVTTQSDQGDKKAGAKASYGSSRPSIGGGGGGGGGSGGSRSVTLDAFEASELRLMVSQRTAAIEDSLEGDEELTLRAVLDYMGCDDWLVEVFMVSEGVIVRLLCSDYAPIML